MNQLAIKNINTLLNINKKSLFIFNNKEITINDDETTEHINENNVNTEYALYFTFNHLLNHPRLDNQLVDILNIALNNLYENESFIKFIENDTNLEEIMDDISLKLDIITEKYNNFRTCNRFFKNYHNYFNIQWNELMKVVLKGLPHFQKVEDNDSDNESEESDESEEGVESSDDEVERCKGD